MDWLLQLVSPPDQKCLAPDQVSPSRIKSIITRAAGISMYQKYHPKSRYRPGSKVSHQISLRSSNAASVTCAPGRGQMADGESRCDDDDHENNVHHFLCFSLSWCQYVMTRMTLTSSDLFFFQIRSRWQLLIIGSHSFPRSIKHLETIIGNKRNKWSANMIRNQGCSTN